jgi:hypothetical protein
LPGGRGRHHDLIGHGQRFPKRSARASSTSSGVRPSPYAISCWDRAIRCWAAGSAA